MKKTLLTIFCALTALCGMAQTEVHFSEQYVVTVNSGTPDAPKDGQQTVAANSDGTVNFVIHNLNIEVSGQSLSLGDVTLKNLNAKEGADGLTYFDGESTFSIPVDKLPTTLQMLVKVGMADFSNIPLFISGKMNDTKLYALMDINIAKPATKINVEIGTDNFGGAKVYSNQLLVIVNNEINGPQDTNVSVIDNGNGTIDFLLKNFSLGAGDDAMDVGNINVKDLAVTEGADGMKYFSYDGTLTIEPGDKEGVDFWLGTILGAIPVKLQGKLNDEKLYVAIDIVLEGMGQNVKVLLGYANVYTDTLAVSLNGESLAPQTADVAVLDNGDGSINLLLKNLILDAGEKMPVGNIYVENIALVEGSDGLKYFSYDAPLTIKPGTVDLEEGQDWVGPALGEIPSVKIKGKLNDEKLFVTIDLNHGMVIFVQFGTDEFPVAKTYDESYFVTLMHEQSSLRSATIQVAENNNATIDFTIKDLVLQGGELTIPIGDLTLHNLETKEKDGKNYFSGNRNISIPADKLPAGAAEELKMAVAMGVFNDIPTVINGWYDDEHVGAYISAEKEFMGYNVNINVQIGFPKGDANGDRRADAADYQYILNLIGNDTYNSNADINASGQVDATDYQFLLNIIAN